MNKDEVEGNSQDMDNNTYGTVEYIARGEDASYIGIVKRDVKIKHGILKQSKTKSLNSSEDEAHRETKSVKFREIIADFVEPISVKSINDEEYMNVLESYVQLCAKLRVRPCRKLTDQLEGLQDSTLRLDTIDLKGTRLDAAHCEALEAVLRALRAQTLNIEQTQLDDDGAISLFEMMEYYEPVTRLIVANNIRLGVRAWLALARLLKRFHRLEYLDVRRTSLDESTMPLLCRVLKLNCTLRVLHLEDNHLSGILIRNLVWGLRTNNLLQDLFLGHNKLTPEDAKLIGSLLITNHTIRLLDLRNNRLQDTGIIFLASALEEQHMGLQLITVWSNQITASSMPSLSRALAFHTTLEGVNLGANVIGNKGVECLKEGLLSSRSIARLVMASCNITNEGAVVMAEIIGDHTTLIHIDLRENNISLAGVMALKCAYAINHKLLRLHLDVMKKANHDPLMEQLLKEIEQFSVRNLDSHKHSDKTIAEKIQRSIISSGPKLTVEQIRERELQVQVDYQLAIKLQKEENDNNCSKQLPILKKEEKRPLPIISPVMASPPDPTKSFGFFSGHYMKLKQKWDEGISLYLSRSDISLAASPGNETSDFYIDSKKSPNSPDSNGDDEDFQDAVEDQEEVTMINKLGHLRDSVRVAKKSQKHSRIFQADDQNNSGDDVVCNNDLRLDFIPKPPLDLNSGDDMTTGDDLTPEILSPQSPNGPQTDFDEVWFTGPENNYSMSPKIRGIAMPSPEPTVSEHSSDYGSEISHDKVSQDSTDNSSTSLYANETEYRENCNTSEKSSYSGIGSCDTVSCDTVSHDTIQISHDTVSNDGGTNHSSDTTHLDELYFNKQQVDSSLVLAGRADTSTSYLTSADNTFLHDKSKHKEIFPNDNQIVVSAEDT